MGYNSPRQIKQKGLFYLYLPVYYWYILALEMSELVVGICGEKETWCMVLSEELIFALIKI